MMRGITTPVLLLGVITIASMLGDIVNIVEDGLIPFSLFQITYLGAIGVFIMRWFAGGLGDFRKTGFELEYALFFGLIFLSLLWTPDAERGFMHALRVLVLSGILYLFVNWLRQPREAVWILGTLAVISVFLGALAIYSTINNPQAIIQDVLTDGTRNASRARIGQHDPNVFASMFFLPMAFTAAVVFSKVNLVLRGAGAVALVVMFVAVLVTFSRSSWVSAIAMLVVLALLYRQYRLFTGGIIAAILLIAAIPEFRFIFMNILNRFISLFTDGLDTSNTIRVMLADASVSMFFDSWLLGVGWRGFPDALLSYYNLQQTHGVFEPHNVTYLVYAELGLIGLLLFGFIVYKIAYIAWQNFRMADTVELKIVTSATGVTFLAYSIFYQFLGSGFLDNQLWITTGIILAMHIYLRMPERTANRHGAPG
ncbi:MAG: O-antigen ligase family protein [Bacteroidetes bacterium HLUCCA01]|nr:MAG: O-antigen ligase family protein [Bacteroidetes bacterium HLUCCA01]